MNVAAYALAFCRIVIGLVFLVSSFSKMFNFAKFNQAVISFNLLPERFSAVTALLFLCCELAVTGLVARGGDLLLPGFLLALILLLIFSCALVSVLARRLQTTCNCFGPSEKPVRVTDVWRNLGFILYALGGCAILAWTQHIPERLGAIEWLLMGMCAGVFVLLWTRLGEIMQLFANN